MQLLETASVILCDFCSKVSHYMLLDFAEKVATYAADQAWADFRFWNLRRHLAGEEFQH